MRCTVGEIAEERLIFVLLNELQRVVGEVIDDVAIALNEFAVMVELRAEVVAPVARAKSVVFVEPPVVRMVWRLHSVVPLAERTGGIAGRFEHIGDRALIKIQSLGARRHAVDAAARMVAAGEELGTRRRTDGADEKPVE